MRAPCFTLASSQAPSQARTAPSAPHELHNISRRKLGHLGALVLAAPLAAAAPPPLAAQAKEQDADRQQRVKAIERAYDQYAGQEALPAITLLRLQPSK